MNKSAEEILIESKAAVRLYFNSEIDRLKLLSVRVITRFISKAIRFIFSLALGSIALCFFFTAIAIKWGAYLNDYALGCLYTGLCLVGLVIIISFVVKNLITNNIMKYVVNEVFEEDDDEDQ